MSTDVKDSELTSALPADSGEGESSTLLHLVGREFPWLSSAEWTDDDNQLQLILRDGTRVLLDVASGEIVQRDRLPEGEEHLRSDFCRKTTAGRLSAARCAEHKGTGTTDRSQSRRAGTE